MFESHILSACPVPLLAVDSELSVSYWNDAADGLFGCSARETYEPHLLELLPGLRDLDHASFGSPDGTWLLHRASRDRTQVRAKGPKGTFNVEVDARTVRFDGQELTVVSLNDMTAFNGSMTNILKAHRELEEFNRVAIGRELRMVALKDEVNELLEALGRPARYTEED